MTEHFGSPKMIKFTNLTLTYLFALFADAYSKFSAGHRHCLPVWCEFSSLTWKKPKGVFSKARCWRCSKIRWHGPLLEHAPSISKVFKLHFKCIPIYSNVTGIAAIAGWVESHSFHFQCNLNEKEMWPWWEPGGRVQGIGQILNKDFICSLSQIFGFHFWKVSHNLLFILQINNSWFVLISRRTFYCIENTNTNSNTFQRNPPDNICKKLAEKNSNLVPH